MLCLDIFKGAQSQRLDEHACLDFDFNALQQLYDSDLRTCLKFSSFGFALLASRSTLRATCFEVSTEVGKIVQHSCSSPQLYVCSLVQFSVFSNQRFVNSFGSTDNVLGHVDDVTVQ